MNPGMKPGMFPPGEIRLHCDSVTYTSEHGPVRVTGRLGVTQPALTVDGDMERRKEEAQKAADDAVERYMDRRVRA